MFHSPHAPATAFTQILRLFKSGTLSDFDIVCGENTHKVHKVVLYSQSRYFAKVFSGNFKVINHRNMEFVAATPDACA